ncbi:MAG: PEGA domain-containing protein [Vicinamibacterales bacterium]
MRNLAGEGRFGPVFTAVDEGGRPVVVRTIALPLTSEQREALLVAFAALCDAPLDHPGILKPLTHGLHGETPYIVHAWGAGESLEARLTREGAIALEPLLPSLTRVAAAIDFAAAAGVHHGALTPADIYLGDDHAAVAGFGLAPAVASAGIEVEVRNDVEALARITCAAAGDPPLRLEVPESALAFVASLHTSTPPEVPVNEPLIEQLTPVAAPPEPRRAAGWPVSKAIAIVLLGVAVGLGGGYLAAQRSGGPEVRRSEGARSEGRETQGTGGTAARAPEPEAASPPPAPPPAESVNPTVGASDPRTPEPDPRTPGPPDPRTAEIIVDSRPSGAQVFVDGALVGTTPLRRDVDPGTHVVRLVLPGHQPWVTRVETARGEALRVAGSLER